MTKGTLALRQIQLGDNADTSKNFVISVPAVADGTLVIKRGNGTDVLSVDNIGIVKLSGARQLAQIVTSQLASLFTTSAIIPYDNTAPRNTEGGALMQLSITPTQIGSTIEVSCTCYYTNSSTSAVILALFQDSIADAKASMVDRGSDAANYGRAVEVGYSFTTASLTPVVIYARMGVAWAGTITSNSTTLGGTIQPTMVAKEYLQ